MNEKIIVINNLLSNLTLDERKRYADELGDEFWNVANHELVFLDVRDYNLYPLIKIGNQTWFAENLRYYAAGSFYNTNNPDQRYGRLYDWYTALTACPAGWHLPTDAEWNTLEMALGMAAADASSTGYRVTRSTSMKSTTGWSNNKNGDNSSGFNAFPAGFYYSGSYYNLGDSAYFWSASEYGATFAWSRYLFYGSAGVERTELWHGSGSSCRYVKD